MNLSRNSIHRWFYETWWMKSPPNDLCNYFWGLVIGFVSIPFCIVGRLLFYATGWDHPHETPIVFRAFMYFLMPVIFIVVTTGLGVAIGYAVFYWQVTVVTLSLVAVISVVVNTWPLYTEPETTKMIKEYIKSTKNKVCPRINWK